MTDGGMLIGTPENLQCESRTPLQCHNRASHIYGPECESETGKLMYLCQGHAEFVQLWMTRHPNDPVECTTHGNIGPVKSYIILKELS